MFFKKKAPKPAPERHWIADWSFNIVLLVWFTSTVAQPFVVPTASMETTIMTGDHLIVDKIPYSPPGAITRYLLPYQDVRRGDVESMEPSTVSMMPEGLLNSLKLEEIQDLVAYLLSRGDEQNPMFR